jgi:hypothetical protein
MSNPSGGVGHTGYTSVGNDVGAELDIARNVRQSAEKQAALAKGALDPTALNDEASAADPTAQASRENHAYREQLRAATTGAPQPQLASAHNEFVDYATRRLDELDERVASLASTVSALADFANPPRYVPSLGGVNATETPSGNRAGLGVERSLAEQREAVIAAEQQRRIELAEELGRAREAVNAAVQQRIELGEGRGLASNDGDEVGKVAPGGTTEPLFPPRAATIEPAAAFDLGGPSDDPRDAFEGGVYDRNDPRRPSAQVERTPSQRAETSNLDDRPAEVQAVQNAGEPSADVAAPAVGDRPSYVSYVSPEPAPPLHEDAPRADEPIAET